MILRDFNSFNCNEEIIEYLENIINSIELLDECRLYKEEQYGFSEDLFSYRNCVEWLIRLNAIIINIKYGLSKSLDHTKSINSAFKKDDNYIMYSYYLEDSVYRQLVLWDIFRQLMNEFYQCGLDKTQSISIYKFIKEQKSKIGIHRYTTLDNYLSTKEHKMVRETLRNHFTHSVDSTSSYIFHAIKNGKINVQSDYMFPKHPLENLYFVVFDFVKLIEFISDVVEEIKQKRDERFALYKVTSVLTCGKEVTDKDYWNCYLIFENIENIVVSCPTGCEQSILDDGEQICKPIALKYKRIHENEESSKTINISISNSKK